MAPKSSTGQQSISSFFRPSQSQPPPSSKRPASTEIISLLSSSDDESLPPSRAPKPAAPLPKRLKLESSAPSVPQPIASTSAATSSTSSVPIDRWRFDPSAASEASQSGVVGRGGERREQFREKLLGRTVGRKSGYLQNEHYLAARADGDGGSEGEMQVADEDAYGEEEVMHGKGKGKQEEPASQFAKFAAKGAMSGGAKGKGKEKEATKGIKYTPLEQQVLALKKANPGVLLMIEVGYKFKFYNEDAVTASRLLGIAHFPSQHMTVASIPIHVKRLINAGQKVGVVRQQETAALKKAGDNKAGPFTRALAALYTSATYIDELSVDPLESAGSSTATLMCVVEDSKSKGDEKVTVALLAVMPNTGEIIYDVFEDGHLRSELETRMLHLQPTELLLQKNLSKQTEAMVNYHVGHDAGIAGMTCRTERITKKLKPEAASSHISDFFSSAIQTDDEIVIDDEEKPNSELGKVLELPAEVIVALAALVQYLKAFKLDTLFLHAHSFTHFLNRSSMSLNGNTLANLEVLRNQTDFKEKGSLMSVLDFCKTSFGRRLLRKWISKPLVSMSAVNDRLDAVTEIMQNSAAGTLVK